MLRRNKSQRELQQQAQKILNSLKGIQVPGSGLDHFTVGDHFRASVISLHSEIINLPDSNSNCIEKVVIGNFGTGKTHFINYLAWLLEQDAPSQCVISKVDLSDLRNPHELQFKIIQNMKPIKGGGFSDVLINTYEAIKENYFRGKYGIEEDSIRKFYGLILFSLLGNASNGLIREEILDLLHVKQPIEKIINLISGKTFQKMFEEDVKRANSINLEFVNTYLDLLKNPKAPISLFEESAKKLSQKGNLVDVVFRTLHHSGTKMIVVLIDELETLTRFNDYLKESLTAIRDLRDSFNRTYDYQGYPPIAFICASTDGFFYDTLRKEEPALFSRWSLLDNILLQNMTGSDIDNLLFSLRELYYLAGFRLKPIENKDGTHDLISMRTKMADMLSDPENPFSSRKLISVLLKEIDRTWVY